MGGWIKLHRKIVDWEWYGNSTIMVLFFHLISIANIEDKEWQGITIKRGQVVSSVAHLSDATGISISKVRRAIAKMESTGEIRVHTTNKYSLFTVCNYEQYQASKSDLVAKPINTTSTKKKAVNKADKGQYTEDFEMFWQIYPNKTDKGRAFECYNARIKSKTVTKEELLQAARNYADKCNADQTPQKYIKHGATFLSNKEPFRDYLNMSKYTETSNEYRLAKFFEGFRQKIDNKYVMNDIQENCDLFHNLLMSGRKPNDIWAVMNALFNSNDNYLIRKYLDVRDFCRGFSDLGSKLILK